MIQTNPVILGNAGKSLFWCHGNRVLRFNTHSCGAPPPLRTAEAVTVCVPLNICVCLCTCTPFSKPELCKKNFFIDRSVFVCVRLCATVL